MSDPSEMVLLRNVDHGSRSRHRVCHGGSKMSTASSTISSELRGATLVDMDLGKYTVKSDRAQQTRVF